MRREPQDGFSPSEDTAYHGAMEAANPHQRTHDELLACAHTNVLVRPFEFRVVLSNEQIAARTALKDTPFGRDYEAEAERMTRIEGLRQHYSEWGMHEATAWQIEQHAADSPFPENCDVDGLMHLFQGGEALNTHSAYMDTRKILAD